MARATNGTDFGRAAEVEWAGANNIFSGWISPSRYEPPTKFEKNFKICLS